ncbi:hypothetical protein AOLI_G00182220 [Acnodon oligacanthus]
MDNGSQTYVLHVRSLGGPTQTGKTEGSLSERVGGVCAQLRINLFPAFCEKHQRVVPHSAQCGGRDECPCRAEAHSAIRITERTRSFFEALLI